MKRHADMIVLLLLALLGVRQPAFAQVGEVAAPSAGVQPDLTVDLSNLESGIPLRMEDGQVLARGALEVQTSIGWGDGDLSNWWDSRTGVAYGFTERWQTSAGVRLREDERNGLGDGDVYLKVLNQVLDSPNEAALWGLELNFPTGQDYERIDYSIPPFAFVVNERDNEVDLALLGAYTKVIDPEKGKRVHVELKHTWVRSAPPGLADGRWFAAVGYDQPMGSGILGTASIWWEERVSPLDDSSAALQLGVRRRQSSRLLWGAGLNIGLDWSDADWGLTFGGQYAP